MLRPLLLLLLFPWIATAETGVPVSYQLPADGPLPKTFRVTLAIVEAKNPDWIVSQFANGVARTVTAENGGMFTETWDGLDDNFMPVPPGTYGVKGIYMAAEKWLVDGEFHSIVPKFAGGASPWLPDPEDWRKPKPFGGDPVGAPLRDVAVGPNGVAVFYYQYLENGTNCPLIDLNKPLGPEQFLRAFNSGGAGGGPCAATDGETVWAFSTDGGPKFVYRSDGKPFGKAEGANRPNSYAPTGWVTAMDNWNSTTLFVAQRGKIENYEPRRYRESATDFVDVITVHDALAGQVQATLPLSRPQALVVHEDMLYALHESGKEFTVSALKLPLAAEPKWRRVLTVPSKITPADLEIDSKGRFYFSDTAANKVYQLNQDGKITQTYGKNAAQVPGAYDPQTFMAPAKLATWRDAEGQDRLLIVENDGPNRVSEWSADGKLLREFMSLQTKANDGYGVDPDNPSHIYLPGHGGWLTRFAVDYAKHEWKVDAVWPLLEDDPRSPKLDRAKFIRVKDQIYLAGRRSYNLFRLEKDRCVLSAAVLRDRPDMSKPAVHSLWNDANGNGRVDNEEVRPVEMPKGLLIYHGQNWLEDLSLVAVNQGGNDVWRLAPEGFDDHGNPIFKEWKPLLTDPIFQAREAGTADAIHGGNELANNFPSDWVGVDGSLEDGFYVQARGGKNFSANEGPQHKLSRYIPDGKGGYQLKWRTGRTAMQRLAEEGEFYGAMRVVKPINGLVSVVDQSRCGVMLFTEDGLFVETIFPDGRRVARNSAGMYPQPGEFFAGHVYPNKENGKVYIAMGKYTPMLYEALGWTTKESPVKRLTTLPKSVSIAASEIGTPPEIALSVRGGSGAARLARFVPALGGAVLDGSLTGWESCEPVNFQAAADQSVEVRAMYDPDHLYLRWHVRLPRAFVEKPRPPLERIFTHDHGADTVSFYFQGDDDAKPGGSADGRPGDVRMVFGLFEGGPVALGLYPKWQGGSPQTYRTPVGQVVFEHAGAIPGIQMGHRKDEDGKGFVIAAAIPRQALPGREAAFSGGYRTLVNFEATFGGHNKFWWANQDGSASRETFDEPTEARLYPGSWAPAQFAGLEKGVLVRNWLICGPFGGPGAEAFKADPNGKMPGTNIDMKKAVQDFYKSMEYPPDNGVVDREAVYKGPILQGYWNPVGSVRWKPAVVNDLDTRVALGSGAQTFYATTWIQAPEETELEFEFQSHPQTDLRWTLNGLEVTGLKYTDVGPLNRHTASQTLKLRVGWNQVWLRGSCMGYPLFKAGLILKGPEEKLWKLRLSNQPAP